MAKPKKRLMRKVYRTYNRVILNGESNVDANESAKFAMHYPKKARVRTWRQAVRHSKAKNVEDNRRYQQLVHDDHLKFKRAGGYNQTDYQLKLHRIKYFHKHGKLTIPAN